MTKTRIGSIFFLAFSSFYFYQSFSITLLPGSHFETMTARTFPYYLGIIGIAISSSMLLFTYVKVDSDDIFDLKKFKTFNFQKGVYFIVAMFFYAYTITTLGFIIATIIFLIIGFKILEEKSWKVILLTSFGVSIIFWFLLTQLLGVYIEQGVIFDYLIGAQS